MRLWKCRESLPVSFVVVEIVRVHSRDNKTRESQLIRFVLVKKAEVWLSLIGFAVAFRSVGIRSRVSFVQRPEAIRSYVIVERFAGIPFTVKV